MYKRLQTTNKRKQMFKSRLTFQKRQTFAADFQTEPQQIVLRKFYKHGIWQAHRNDRTRRIASKNYKRN